MKTFFGAFTGSIVAVVLIVLTAGGITTCVVSKKPKIEDHSYLIIEMHGDIPEYDPPGGIMTEIAGGDTETLQRILSNLKKARFDDRIDGVIFKISSASTYGLATSHEIRGAIKRLQESGKKVYGFAESFHLRQYPLLAACDEIIAPLTADINFTGFALTTIYVKNTLDKLGIKPNIHKIKDYKSAAELVTREDMSPAARENFEWLLDEGWQNLTQSLAEDRQMSEEKITELMEHALFTAQESVDGGLIDRLMYWDALEEELMRKDDDDLRKVTQERYAEVEPSKVGLEGDKTIAVIHGQGAIIGRKSGVNPLLGVTMGHESIVAEFRRARKDEDVAAIVFRVDSGGGDAFASNLISHEVEVTAATKPVVVSMVDVAGSGGYAIAYTASKILADPMTITGSIGSISGKFNIRGFHDMLGITHDNVSRGPMALMGSAFRDYTPEERARFEDNHWDGFNMWLRDVAEHRGMSFEDAEKLAYGRVWSGRQAVDNGLVDELGDLTRAIEVAKQLAEIPAEEKVTVAHFPKKKTLIESLLSRDRDLATAARWVVYRFIQDDIDETWRTINRNPELATDLVKPY